MIHLTDDYLIIRNETDLTQLIENSEHSSKSYYHYYKKAFIRTYKLTTFPAYYKRSQDGHTWDKISAEFFKKLVIAQLDDLTNRKRQLVELLPLVQLTGAETAEKESDI